MTELTINYQAKAIMDNVIVKPFPSEEKSLGGIFVPDSARERNNKAWIVSYGNGTAKHKMKDGIGKGDVCFHIKDAGMEILINGEKHYIIKMQDILAYAKNN